MNIECKNCGDTGYTLEVDEELGEILVRCDACWWKEQDSEFKEGEG